jgi:two-component sensor histidine kinase
VKIFSTILLILFFRLLAFSQTSEWKPIPKGNPLSTKIIKDQAIWKKMKKPKPNLFKSSLVYLDIEPIFYNKVKPNILPKAEFIEVQLTIKEQIKCDGEFLFKDNSKTKIKYLDKAHGFFTNDIYCLAEDKNGHIYFGTQSNGIGKFNGDFLQILQGDSLHPLSIITALFNDSNDRLWIGTNTKVYYIKDHKLHFLNLKENVSIKGIQEDYQGNIWISTIEEGSFCLTNKNIFQYKKDMPDKEISSVAVEKGGRIWFALSDKAIAFIQNDSLFGYPTTYNDAARHFYLDNDKLWIGTFGGSFLQYKNDSLYKVKYNNESQTPNMYSCFRNDKGLWFSLYGGGVYLLDDNGMVRRFSNMNGLSGNDIHTIMPDKFGNIWAGGLYEGVSRIEDVIFQSLNNSALTGTCSEIEVFNDDIWYFYNGNNTIKYENGDYWNISNAGTKDVQKNRHLTDGTIVGSNEAWLANWGVGFTHLKEKEFTYFKLQESTIYDQSIFNIQVDSLQNVFGISYSGKLYTLRDNQIYDLSKSFKDSSITFYKTYKWDSGLIYITCSKGLLILKNGYYKFIDENVTSQIGTIQTLQKTDSSLLLFGNNGIQEINHNGDKQIHFYKIDVFNNLSIRSAENIANHLFLITTNKGVLEIDISSTKIKSKLYGTEYGLPLLDFNQVQKIKEKILLLGNELYEYHPNFKKQSKTPPILNLNYLQLNKNTIELNQLHSIKQEDVLTFVFSSISWGISREMVYQLIKNGKNNEIWKTSETSTLTIEELQFGNYTLLVKSINNDGVSETFENSFRVKKNWYQTIWFKLLLIITTLLIIAFYIYIKHKKALKIQRNLEFQVEEKTIELKLEKEELAKQLDDNNILLKEVHHRVKNNMQLVSSLLELQSEFATDDFSKDVLRKGNDRIKALAFAHQKLYQNEDYENIELKDYFNQIIHHLLGNTDCKATIDIPDDLLINIERGQVLGFIINELIVNSLKYAWPNKIDKKCLSVFITIKDKYLYFVYRDNGIGFPKTFSLKENKSLGYTLIPSFVKRQLKGTMSCSNANGVIVKITFLL